VFVREGVMSAERVLSRIRDARSDQDAYEAQQMLKTVYHRLRSRGKLEEGYDLLRLGAQAQLSQGQVSLHHAEK
jgi:uncharacterized protein (DUF2267 family)